MSDPTCACGNTARYVDQRGALTCGICPIKAGDDSIRFSDVPRLLAWAREFTVIMEVDQQDCYSDKMDKIEAAHGALRDIIQRGPR